MKRQTWESLLDGSRPGLGAATFRAALCCCELPYREAMKLRRACYRAGVLPSHAAAVPVICVGNITTGGTGKTPMVAWVVARLREMGRKPAVLTRGYKAVAGKSDEAELLREVCGVPVIVNGDRVAGSAAAVEQGADVLVMDDGFQHRRLRRDLDVVLIDATNPFGRGHCLPRGLLREPLSALRDAHALVLTRSDQANPDSLARLRDELRRLAPRASQHLAVHAPSRWLAPDGAEHPPDGLAGRKVLAFCGLGNPDAFYRTLTGLGVVVADSRSFPDHAAYTAADVGELAAAAKQCGASVLATTRKDGVKLAGLDVEACLPVGMAWQLDVQMQLVDGGQELVEALRRILR